MDVHLKNWTVTILIESLAHKPFTQPACAQTLYNFLNRQFPGANYHSVYEAGFSGFLTHYKLKEMGINNIVVNSADVPTSQKEQLQKDDPTDSRKHARSLRGGELTEIYVPEPSSLQERLLIHMRATLVKDMVRFK